MFGPKALNGREIPNDQPTPTGPRIRSSTGREVELTVEEIEGRTYLAFEEDGQVVLDLDVNNARAFAIALVQMIDSVVPLQEDFLKAG